jgi:predicted RNA-binding Zn ribbon-like protein
VTANRFRFDCGSLALDLAATVGQRFGEAVEQLARPSDLARWLRDAGLVDPQTAVGEAGHEAGLQLRERCRMLFLDRSRGRRRRWCSMAECGNRAKVAAHRERARAG